MTTLRRCDALVIALVGKDLAEGWWNSPNRAFNNKKPIDCDIDKVYEYLIKFYD